MVVAKEWFTIEEAAEYLCISKRSIYKLTHENRLPAYLIGHERHRRFRKEDLDKVPRLTEPPKIIDSIMALSSSADPVLAALWDNDGDAIYDRV